MSKLSLNEMNEWRVAAQNLFKEYSELTDTPTQVINPVDFYNFERAAHKTEREVMVYDLMHVRTSDVVIVNLSRLNTSVGTCIELYQSHIQGTPIMAFGSVEDYEKLHPWLKEMIHRCELRLIDVIDHIKDFYMVQ